MTHSSTSKMASRIGPRPSLIGGVFKHLTTPSPLQSRSPNTLPNPKTKRPTKAKVGERVAKTRAITAKIRGRKSRLATRAGKKNRRAKKRHRSHEACCTKATGLIGYAIVWRGSRSTFLLPNSRATPQCPRRNPNSAWVLSNASAHSITNSLHSPRNGSCM